MAAVTTFASPPPFYANTSTVTAAPSCMPCLWLALNPVSATWPSVPNNISTLRTVRTIVDPNIDSTWISTYGCNTAVLSQYNSVYPNAFYTVDTDCNLVASYYWGANDNMVTLTLDTTTDQYFEVGDRLGVVGAYTTTVNGTAKCTSGGLRLLSTTVGTYTGRTLVPSNPTVLIPQNPITNSDQSILAPVTSYITYTVGGRSDASLTPIRILPDLSDYLPDYPEVAQCTYVSPGPPPSVLKPANVLTEPPITIPLKTVAPVTTSTSTVPTTSATPGSNPGDGGAPPTSSTSRPTTSSDVSISSRSTSAAQPIVTTSREAEPTDEPTSSSAPPASDPPASHPPASNPPASNPPASNPPASNPPASNPPASNPPASNPPAPNPATSDPPASSLPAPSPPASSVPASNPPAPSLPLSTPSTVQSNGGPSPTPETSSTGNGQLAPTPPTDPGTSPGAGNAGSQGSATSSAVAIDPAASSGTAATSAPLGGFIAAGIGLTLPSASNIPSISVISANPSAVVIGGSVTISAGGSAITSSGDVISVLPSGSGVVVQPVQSASPPVVVVGGSVSLTAGGAATTINGVGLSVLPSGQGVQVVSSGITSTALLGETGTAVGSGQAAITIAGVEVSAVLPTPSAVVVGGSVTLASDSPVATVSGVQFSLLPSGQGVQVVSAGSTTTIATSSETTVAGVEISPVEESSEATTLVPSTASGFVLGGTTTLFSNGPAATVSGVVYSVLPANIVEVVSGTVTQYVVGGSTTISPGSPATVSGTVYSALPNGSGVVIVASSRTTTVSATGTESPSGATQSVQTYTGAASNSKKLSYTIAVAAVYLAVF